jgi:hypothetical protein
MPRLFHIGIGKHDDHQIALIGERLGSLAGAYPRPTVIQSLDAIEPSRLSIGEQLLTVLRRAQSVKPRLDIHEKNIEVIRLMHKVGVEIMAGRVTAASWR